MTQEDLHEQQLRIQWLERQMLKSEFDMAMELRKLRRQTWAIIVSGAGIVIGAFAAGAAWMHFIASK